MNIQNDGEPTLAEQIAAVRHVYDCWLRLSMIGPQVDALRAALATLERSELLETVAAAAREYLTASFHTPSIVNAITDLDAAVAALDVGGARGAQKGFAQRHVYSDKDAEWWLAMAEKERDY